jgi:hypothetical protein
LDANSTGASNTAVGSGALSANTTANDNTGVGYSALIATTTGANNVSMGSYALGTNTTGHRNTGIGESCLRYNTTGFRNTAVGAAALTANTTADYNTAVGQVTLEFCTEGHSNSGFGYAALNAVTTGDTNLAIGYDSGNAGSPSGSITTADGQMCLGGSGITHAFTKVAITATSDARDKTDITPCDLGLDFINQLKPITYRWDERIKYSDDQSIVPDGTHKKEQLECGFLAQDVEAIEEQYGYKQADKSNLITTLTSDGTTYGLKYDRLVLMLTKAIQELSAKVEDLEKQKD